MLRQQKRECLSSFRDLQKNIKDLYQNNCNMDFDRHEQDLQIQELKIIEDSCLNMDKFKLQRNRLQKLKKESQLMDEELKQAKHQTQVLRQNCNRLQQYRSKFEESSLLVQKQNFQINRLKQINSQYATKLQAFEKEKFKEQIRSFKEEILMKNSQINQLKQNVRNLCLQNLQSKEINEQLGEKVEQLQRVVRLQKQGRKVLQEQTCRKWQQTKGQIAVLRERVTISNQQLQRQFKQSQMVKQTLCSKQAEIQQLFQTLISLKNHSEHSLKQSRLFACQLQAAIDQREEDILRLTLELKEERKQTSLRKQENVQLQKQLSRLAQFQTESLIQKQSILQKIFEDSTIIESADKQINALRVRVVELQNELTASTLQKTQERQQLRVSQEVRELLLAQWDLSCRQLQNLQFRPIKKL